jgi:hypothetical protein
VLATYFSTKGKPKQVVAIRDSKFDASPREKKLYEQNSLPVFDRGCVVSATNHLVFAEFER